MFVVATATFHLIYALIVLSLDRRRVIHFAVTPNPTQDWLSRQMTEAFPGTLHLAICCGTGTQPMVRHSVIAFERWGSRRLSLRRDLRGRTPTLSVSSVRSAENVWITSSSSTSAICAAFYRAIFNTIMTPAPIFRSARTARDLVPYNLPRPATSLPSQRLAVCTIAMSVEPLRRHVLACTPSNCRHANFEQGQGSALPIFSFLLLRYPTMVVFLLCLTFGGVPSASPRKSSPRPKRDGRCRLDARAGNKAVHVPLAVIPNVA